MISEQFEVFRDLVHFADETRTHDTDHALHLLKFFKLWFPVFLLTFNCWYLGLFRCRGCLIGFFLYLFFLFVLLRLMLQLRPS